MPLIRCDYSDQYMNEDQLVEINKVVYDVSAKLCGYSENDAQDKISIFNSKYGPFDHSTAAAEIEIRAKKSEFDNEVISPNEVRKKWLTSYESALVALAKEIELGAPIIFTVTFQDWEVVVISSSGSVPN